MKRATLTLAAIAALVGCGNGKSAPTNALGESCSASGPACSGGVTPLCCGGVCTDTDSDPANCGQCGTPSCVGCSQGSCISLMDICPGGTALCAHPDGGQGCVCAGACVDLASDPNNCGQCRNACPSAICDMSACF